LTPGNSLFLGKTKATVSPIGKPVTVIHIPYGPQIVADAGYDGYNRVKEFAAYLGAEFHDARGGLRPLSAKHGRG